MRGIVERVREAHRREETRTAVPERPATRRQAPLKDAAKPGATDVPTAKKEGVILRT